LENCHTFGLDIFSRLGLFLIVLHVTIK
jgi:hypothetical protein